MCGVREIDCSNIAPPVVVTLPLQQMGIWGIYESNWDSDVVFIDPYLPVAWQKVVGVHEMSHYLDYQLGGLRRKEDGAYDVTELCQSESDGFRVANAWVWYVGYDQEYARYDWRNDYLHCQ